MPSGTCVAPACPALAPCLLFLLACPCNMLILPASTCLPHHIRYTLLCPRRTKAPSLHTLLPSSSIQTPSLAPPGTRALHKGPCHPGVSLGATGRCREWYCLRCRALLLCSPPKPHPKPAHLRPLLGRCYLVCGLPRHRGTPPTVRRQNCTLHGSFHQLSRNVEGAPCRCSRCGRLLRWWVRAAARYAAAILVGASRRSPPCSWLPLDGVLCSLRPTCRDVLLTAAALLQGVLRARQYTGGLPHVPRIPTRHLEQVQVAEGSIQGFGPGFTPAPPQQRWAPAAEVPHSGGSTAPLRADLLAGERHGHPLG